MIPEQYIIVVQYGNGPIYISGTRDDAHIAMRDCEDLQERLDKRRRRQKRGAWPKVSLWTHVRDFKK